MKSQMYVVLAHRYGDTEKHSYLLGLYAKKQAAITAAEAEEAYRGGKYGCQVLEVVPGAGDREHKEIRPAKSLWQTAISGDSE